MENELIEAVTVDYKRDLKLTHHQEQIVLGSLLGRGMIISPPGNRECYFRMRQSIKEDINIIAYKATELKKFSRPKAFGEDKNSYTWNSISHEIWREFYDFCYCDGKKDITMKWMDKLTDKAIAVYFLDVGKINKGLIELNVSRVVNKQIICTFFNEVDCKCQVFENKIRFNKKGTDNLIRIMDQSIPTYLLYRISG